MKRTLLFIIKCLGAFLLLVFIFVNILLAYWGLTSIIITAIVYAFIWCFAWLLVSRIATDIKKRKNYLLLVTSIVMSLFAAELTLKYIIVTDDTRGQDFGFSSWPYGVPAIENLISKYGDKRDMRLKTGHPNTIETPDGNEYNYPHRYNSLGLRGKDHTPDPTTFTIVGLGDSYTEGFGTPEDSTWLQLLENKLGQRNISGKKIRCINGGIAGSDPFLEYVILEKLLLRYEPKMVLVCINETDIDDVIKSGGWERFSDSGALVCRPHPWWYLMYQSSVIARYVIHYHRNWLLLNDKEYESEKRNAIEKIENCLMHDYLKLAHEHNFKLIAVIHPLRDELES